MGVTDWSSVADSTGAHSQRRTRYTTHLNVSLLGLRTTPPHNVHNNVVAIQNYSKHPDLMVYNPFLSSFSLFLSSSSKGEERVSGSHI